VIGIDKSSRHRHIVGRFGEYLVCNWLSRSGFEVCIVDHTGLDVIAYHPRRKQRLGITVKARTRSPGTEKGSVYIFRAAKDDRQKLLDACKAFSCEPWIAIYAECDAHADLFLTSLANYDQKYRVSERAVDGWTMREKRIGEYGADSEVRHIRIEFTAAHWWQDDEGW
jgi:Holliday junction resolvase-like predicted endonuclease